MTIVGVLGALLGLLAFPFAFVNRTRLRVAVFFALFLIQVGAGIFYYTWALTNTSDSPLYYFDELGFYESGFGFNTQFVVYLVQTMKLAIGGTYLDYFLIFQGFGFWVTVFLMRIFEEISLELEVEQPGFSYFLLFLPSLHFWTASIGKDGPLVMATAMAVWAAMRLRSRILVFALAIIIMLLFRPHIALIAMGAMSVAALIDSRSRAIVKIFLVMASLGAMAVVMGTVQTSFGVDVTSAGSLDDFFTRQSEVSETIDTGTAVIGASYPFRLFSLLFRPFFIDAGGALGIVASLENVLMVVMFGTMAKRLGDTVKLFRNVFFLRFALVFTIALILLLAFVYYNVGLGLRQRSMFLPPLLSFFVALRCLKPAKLQVRAQAGSYA